MFFLRSFLCFSKCRYSAVLHYIGDKAKVLKHHEKCKLLIYK